MKKRIERFLKRLKLKLYIWTTKGAGSFATQEEEISSYEKTCFLICLKTIKHKNTKFMIAPMSQKRYLENKDMDIFITINDGRIDLTNHIYHYDVKLSKRDWERITYVFDTETEKRRLNYEDTINSQIKNSLHSVLERVSNLTDNTTNQGIN
jgi:hypothetical protein